MRKVAIVACSNGLESYKRKQMEDLQRVFENMGLHLVFSPFLYAGETDVRSAGAKERAAVLMKFYQDEEITDIFDVSGGDVAVEIVPYIDFDVIAKSKARFWGYSDLTTIINAIYTKTGKVSNLFQVRNLVRKCGKEQVERFQDYFHGGTQLLDVSYELVRGTKISGTLVGGNARCLLKLAGSPFFPDMKDKVLFLEGLSGTVPQLVTFFSQLKIIGVWDKVSGVVLGTFTEMEKKNCSPTAAELILEMTDASLPVAVTKEVGHGADAKCLLMGEEIIIE